MCRSRFWFLSAILVLGIVVSAPAHADIIFTGEFTDLSNPREIRVGPNTTGSLTVNDGSILNMEAGTSTDEGVHLFFGRNPGSFGFGLIDGPGSEINVIGSNFPSQSNLTASFAHIGRGGDGALTIQNGGLLTITDPLAANGTGELQGETLMVGRDSATGTLTMNDGHVILDSRGTFVQVGRNGGDGTITMTNGSTMLVSSSDADVAGGGDSHITLGRDNGGTGSMLIQDSQVTINADNTSASMLIGRDDASSSGVLTITGATAELNITGESSTLLVGNFGQGTMTASDGAKVYLGGDDAELLLGLEPGSSGILAVSGGATVDVGDTGGFAQVGAAYANEGRPEGGIGLMTVTGPGSRVSVAGDLLIGAPLSLGGGTSNGTVVVSNGGLLEAENVIIGLGGTLAGSGTIAANVHLDDGSLTPGNTPGTIHIDGNFLMTAGEFVIEIGGLGAGEFDVVDITGGADLLGGTVLFQFIDGFLPSAGDTLEFLTALGPITVDTISFAFAGLAPGFLFDVDFSAGGLLFAAVNDGIAIAVPEPASLFVFLLGLGFMVLLSARGLRRPTDSEGGLARQG